jgi:6-phospho-3-hexuloisomerase
VRETTDEIICEIRDVIESSDFTQVADFIENIMVAKRIVVFGAGRVGLMMKSFNMRLGHLGFQSYYLTESNVPKVEKGDLLLLGSGSGNTLSVQTMATLAASKGLKILLITANQESKTSVLATSIIRIDAQTKAYEVDRRRSIQPMTTLFEQSLLVTLDALVILLMRQSKQNNSDLESRHNSLE